jgi:hypothetical protein
MAKFLSDEWFTKAQEMRAAAGDLNLPDVIKDLVLNVTVTREDGSILDMCVNAGNIEKGHNAGAPTKLSLPIAVARKLFIDNDQSAGMQAFMSGQMKIEGDMSKLMAMQTVQPTAEQEQLRLKLVSITD